MNALFLAFAHLRFTWARSLIVILIGAMILAVPLVSQTILSGGQEALTKRADATPLVLGARWSALDLTIAALYFSEEHPEPVPMREVEAVWDIALFLHLIGEDLWPHLGERSA